MSPSPVLPLPPPNPVPELEPDMRDQLDLTRRMLINGLSELTIRKVVYRVDQIHAVEEIQEFSANLKFPAIAESRQSERSLHGKIHGSIAWTVVGVPSEISL